MQYLEIIKKRLENEEEIAFANFEEYAELYGYDETEDYFSFGLKRAIEIIGAYIRLEKDEDRELEEVTNQLENLKRYCEKNINEYENTESQFFSLSEDAGKYIKGKKEEFKKDIEALNAAIDIIKNKK